MIKKMISLVENKSSIDLNIYNQFLDRIVMPALLILVLINIFFEMRSTINLYQKNKYKLTPFKNSLLLNFYFLDKLVLILIGITGFIYYFIFNYFIFLFLMAIFLIFLIILKLRYYKTKLLNSIFNSKLTFFIIMKNLLIFLIYLSIPLYFDSYHSILFLSYLYLLNYRLIFYALTPLDKLYTLIKTKKLIKKIRKLNLANTFFISSNYNKSIIDHLEIFLRKHYLINTMINPLCEQDFLEGITKGLKYDYSFISNDYPLISNKLNNNLNRIIYDHKIKKIIYNKLTIDIDSLYHYEIVNKNLTNNQTKIYKGNKLIESFQSDLYFLINQELLILCLCFINELNLKYNLLLNTNLMEIFNINNEENIYFISNNRLLSLYEINKIYSELSKLNSPIVTMLKTDNSNLDYKLAKIISMYSDQLIYYHSKKQEQFIAMIPHNLKLKNIFVTKNLDNYQNYYTKLDLAKPYVILKLEF